MDKDRYLKETALLNYSCFLIKDLINDKKWNELDDFNKINKTIDHN